MCHPHGGIVDDCLVYRLGDAEYLIVINASNIDKDVAWMREHAGRRLVADESDQFCLLALQGPKAPAILTRATQRDLSGVARNSFVDIEVAGKAVRAARTGYTGEDGFEIFTEAAAGPAVWNALLEIGRADGVVPCGLGARDTLRLEARLCLYGNDIDDTTNPYEAGLAWTVKLDKGDFIGRDALRAVKEKGPARKLVGFEVTAAAIARHGHAVHASDEDATAAGVVTSGTKAPTVGKPIGLAYVPPALSAIGTKLSIDVRGKRVPAVVVKTPFYKRET
jgi:aminomethyltransferase